MWHRTLILHIVRKKAQRCQQQCLIRKKVSYQEHIPAQEQKDKIQETQYLKLECQCSFYLS